MYVLSFCVGSREGLICQRIVNTSLGWGPSPPDVTAFIFSVWFQGPTLVSDRDSKCLWPQKNVIFEWEYLQTAVSSTFPVADNDKPGLLFSLVNWAIKAMSEHSLLLLCQGFWPHPYLSLYEHEWDFWLDKKIIWGSNLSNESMCVWPELPLSVGFPCIWHAQAFWW